MYDFNVEYPLLFANKINFIKYIIRSNLFKMNKHAVAPRSDHDTWRSRT